ncbi:MAG: DUF2339 domain-containing protein [Oscillospiraceae bacterium]|nr:DUF2339 domain-containing protein [Oscillospiraceae bacterium]
MGNSPVGKLKNALERLYASKNLVEEAFSEFESQDLPKENETLRENVRILTEKLETIEKALAGLENEYAVLEDNFRDELERKHSAMLSQSDKRMQEYFSARLEAETKRLNNLQTQLYRQLDRITSDLHVLESGEREEITAELNDLTKKVKGHVCAAQKRADEAWAELFTDKTKAIENMQDPEIGDKALKVVRKFFNWETFFGLRLVSSLGILLIIIGVFTFGRYVYLQMSNQAQCITIFALGLLFLIAGEILNKKWRGVFSLALTAGGSGILFLATALGYLTLEVLPMTAALGICAGVSVVTFVLAIRHNSQTISIFALIGGYLPMLALEPGSDIIIWGVIYFTILNLFSLALATRKNWRLARFIGLFSGMISEFILIFYGNHLDVDIDLKIIIISSIAVAYIAYLIIPVFGALFTKSKIKPADIVLLTFNVFFRFLLGLLAVYVYRFEKFDALVPAFIALSCIIMAVLAERGNYKSVLEKDKGSLRALFFVTSVTFSALIVLFWFDSVWFSSGWLIEGVGLLLYGLLRNRKRFTVAGSVIGILCVFVFVLFNVPDYTNSLFIWQYLLVTLGAISVAIILAVKTIPQKHKDVQIYQFAAAFNLWIYFIYLFQNPILEYFRKSVDIIILICITFGMVYSFILPRIRAVYCAGVHTASIFVGVISVVWLFWFNAYSSGILQENPEMLIKIIVFILYIITNIISVFWMRDLLQFMVLKKALPLKFYPLLLSGYFVLAVTQNLVVQFELQASSMILTFIFGFTALCWVFFGFAKRNNIIRVSGLSLSFFTVIKLFILDLSDLTTEFRIVSYFVMGILLLAISFIYQYFSKKLKNNVQ